MNNVGGHMNSDKNKSSDFIYRIRALIQNYKEDKN